MSKQDQDCMRQWTREHGKAVRQLSVRQNNTKHAAGTLPLNMNRKELPIGDRVTEEPTRTGRQITLSNRALASYWGKKKLFLKLFLFAEALKARINSTDQWKRPIYMLQLKAEVEIRLFNVFFWERKRDSGFRRKKERDAGFPWKRSGNGGSGLPFPDPRNS